MSPHNYKAPRRTNDSIIAQARLAKGITQAQLAEALGVTQQQIQKWETGERNPKVESLIKIAKELDLDWVQLVNPDDK